MMHQLWQPRSVLSLNVLCINILVYFILWTILCVYIYIYNYFILLYYLLHVSWCKYILLQPSKDCQDILELFGMFLFHLGPLGCWQHQVEDRSTGYWLIHKIESAVRVSVCKYMYTVTVTLRKKWCKWPKLGAFALWKCSPTDVPGADALYCSARRPEQRVSVPTEPQRCGVIFSPSLFQKRQHLCHMSTHKRKEVIIGVLCWRVKTATPTITTIRSR